MHSGVKLRRNIKKTIEISQIKKDKNPKIKLEKAPILRG